jgi:predicted anti-sigma-YlaC factor YlaD
MIAMDCTKSLELLSDYHDGHLNENDKEFVKSHLCKCPPCEGIFKELATITIVASEIRQTTILFPDEELIWKRMNLARRTVH